MSIDFPSPATLNQIHTAAGASWKYDGAKWISYSAGGDITAVIAGTGMNGGGTSGDVTLNLTTPVSIANGGTGSTNGTGLPYVTGGPYLPLTGGTLSGPLHATTLTASSGVYIDNNNSYYWIGGRAILGSDGGTVFIQDNSGGFNTIQFAANNNYYDQTAHHFRSRSYYEAMSIYPGSSDPVHVNCSSAGHARIWFNCDGVRAWTVGAANNSYFYIADESAGAVRALIDPSGNFQANGNINANGAQLQGASVSVSGQIWTSGTVWPDQGIQCKQGDGGGWGGNRYYFFWDGSIQCWIDSTYAGSIQYQSDYRIKKDITPLASTWDRIKELRPVSYTHRDFTPPVEVEERLGRGETKPFFPGDDIERWGFVAHELQETLTGSAASGVKDSPNTIQSPNPFTLIAALTRALQEAMTRIEALEADLA